MYGIQDQYGDKNTFEEHQQQLQQQNGGKSVMDQPVKTTIHTEDVKEIVKILNDKPFNEQYSLVTFDELNVQEQLNVLNKILSELDDSFKSIKEKPQDQIIFEVVQFLQVLNYPVPTNPPEDTNWQNGLFNAERKIIYPVFYYITTRFQELKKRAYLAKFLVPYQLPDVVPMDDEIKKYMDEYKDLQAQFQVTHSQLESQEKESMNPEELKKEINQLQQERKQLLSKINVFKGKNTNNPQFQALLEVTNLLRKEQEEEQRIQDKLRQQRAHLEWADQQLLACQQRLFDAKRSVAPENTPEQMLMSVRNEVKKNRELANERLAVEINEKKKKLEQHEKLLRDPPVTINELNQLETTQVNLRRNVNIMEDKLAQQVNPHSDKLAIFKQQAAMVKKQKDRVINEQKRVEQEMGTLEQEVKEKQEKLYKERGPGFSNDEFKNFVEQLKVKHAKYKKLNKELADIKGEISVLSRTEKILQAQNQQYYKNFEQTEHQGGNLEKGKTVEEVQNLVSQARRTLDEKKMKLQPRIKQLKDLREEFKDLEGTYKEKKSDYDKIMVGSESEITNLENQVKKLQDEYEKEEQRLEELKKNTEVITDKLAKLNKEIDYQKGYSKLSEEHPTYVSEFESKSKKLEQEVKDLRGQREVIKENYEPHQRQIQMFSDIKTLLQAKLQSQGSGGGNQNYGTQNQSGNVNRLVIDN